MGEIDIIELLKRLKEGKAPKKIEINGEKYYYNEKWNDVFYAYLDRDDKKIFQNFVDFDTKIRILDKPKSSHIIEEIDNEYEEITLSLNNYAQGNTILKLINKVNEITKYINNKEEK